MPIRYRCFNCNQLISISTRMAGRSVNCPKCKTKTTVPEEDQVQPTQTAATETAADRQTTKSETSRPKASQTGRAKSAVVTAQAETSTNWEEEEEDDGFRLSREKLEMEEMDLTPMVDVTFLLLIFFMITASFSLQKTIQVPPPEQEQEGKAVLPQLEDFEPDSIIVNIDAENNIYLDDDLLVDTTALVDALMDNGKSEILITAHNDAFHETVVLVVDAANEAGMQKIRLASRAGGF